MKFRILIIISIVFAFPACIQAATRDTGNSPVLKKSRSPITVANEAVSPADTLDTVELDFGDFKVLMPGIEVYINDSIRQTDTIEIYPEIGYSLDSQVVVLRKNSGIKSIEVFESYKTVLTIGDQGPHIDLYDWKGYESAWMRLKPAGNGFLMKIIPEKEASRFPEFTKEELITVADKTEKGWGDILRKPYSGNWKNHVGTGVGIRRLRFVVTDVHGKVFEKMLVAYIAMGC